MTSASTPWMGSRRLWQGNSQSRPGKDSSEKLKLSLVVGHLLYRLKHMTKKCLRVRHLKAGLKEPRGESFNDC